MEEPIIKVQNLSLIYDVGKSNEVRALDDVSCEIYPNEYIIFFGPSGCGKSTLLYSLAALETPTSGKIIIGKRELGNFSAGDLLRYHQISIGMVFQAYYLLPDLNIYDNVSLPQMFSEIAPNIRAQRVNFLLERFNIAGVANRKPTQLSGGQQQRAAIARALVNNPSMIFADEPVGNLDSKNAEIVMNILSELNENDKKTVICVTHDPSYLHFAHRVFYIKDGKIVKVVANPKKVLQGVAKEPVSDLDLLTQSYPNLNEAQLRTKLILNDVLFNLSVSDQQKLEDAISRYLLKQISDREMFEIFDKPASEGGVALYSQKAQDLAKKVVALAKEIEIFKPADSLALDANQKNAVALRRYLFDKFVFNVSFDQIKKIDEILAKRLALKINDQELEKLLDLSASHGGVGLNRRLVKKIMREVEVILVKK